MLKKVIDYHNFEKITDPDTGFRIYETPHGNVPSVTTILSKTSESKEFLNKWRERLGDKEADQQVKEAQALGTLLHTHLENYVAGIDRPTGNNRIRRLAKDMSDVIIGQGLVNVNEVWASEQPLWFPELYAGTADLIMVHKGVLCIGDFKNTKKPKKEEWIADYKLQLLAYAMAHNEVYGTDIKKGVIFMVSRDCVYQEFLVDGLEFEKQHDLWLTRLEKFYNNQ